MNETIKTIGTKSLEWMLVGALVLGGVCLKEEYFPTKHQPQSRIENTCIYRDVDKNGKYDTLLVDLYKVSSDGERELVSHREETLGYQVPKDQVENHGGAGCQYIIN